MIELTLADGTPIMVNIDAIESLRPAADGTFLMFLSGRSETVRESYEAVTQMFDPEAQAVEPC